MSTTDDEDDLFGEIRGLADQLGLERRAYVDAGRDDAWLADVVDSHPPASRRPRRVRTLLGAAAVAAVVSGGFVLLGGDDPAGRDRGPSESSVALQAPLPPVPSATSATGEEALKSQLDRVYGPDVALGPARSSHEKADLDGSYALSAVPLSACESCRQLTVGELAAASTDVVQVKDQGASAQPMRATVVRSFKGATVVGDRIVISDPTPAVQLRPGLGDPDTVYFMQQVEPGSFVTFASAYVEARPGRFFARDVLPSISVSEFTLRELVRATK